MMTVPNEVESIIARFYKWEREKPDATFLRQPSGDSWKVTTFAEAGKAARKMTTALQGKGLQPGDHIGILSKNCMHWVIADLAIMMGGYVSVPFYASLPKGKLEEVVALSDIKALFIGKLDKWGDKGDDLSEDLICIKFPHYQGNAEITKGHEWDALIEANPPMEGYPTPDLNDLWTIKFTSGTTGTPKGVMHLHRTPGWIMYDEDQTHWIGLSKIKEHRFFSFLPMNHVGERLGVEVPCIYYGGSISFAESLETFAQNIRDTQPTMLFAVPRIWTKFYHGVLSKMSAKKLDRLLSIPLVSSMIKKKVKTALGLNSIEVAATGAAITPEYLKNWYKKLGIHLVEAYGMTEVCGSMTNGPELDSPPDSVGRVIPKGEVKVHEETGEILMKTPYMMTGYYKDPEKTAEVLVDGWMHSGDRGTIDDKGYVRVIGRVKDAFKTSKGSYVTPNPMEEVISKNDFIEQCCVAGLGIPQPICLVNLSEQGDQVDQATIAASLSSAIEDLNKTLSNYEKISTVIVTNETWSESNEMLTPTLKVRRGKLDEVYGKQYLDWHSSSENVIWQNK